MSTIDPKLPDGIRVEVLAPRSRRVRNPAPEWVVWIDGERAGRLEQWTVPRASATFYRATAFHPVTGVTIPLESSTEFIEQIEKIAAARRDPGRFVHRSSWD